MRLTRTLAALAAFATTALLFAAPASAQATRTWVSGVGDDANPCSRTAPCKTFAGAISKTAASGEIDCLDPGGFGGLTITKAITIDCTAPGGIGGVLVSGTNGFVVNAGTADKVQLIGLDINGLGPAPGPGINGVLVVQAGNVSIINCLIYGFTATAYASGVVGSAGIAVAPSSNPVKVYIGNTIIRNNNSGVAINPASSSVFATVELDHVTLDDNAQTGSTAAANLVLNTTSSTAILTNSTFTGGVAIANPGPGSVISYENNLIRPAGGVTTSLPLQ
jgi:hypothetical protein